MKAKPTLKTDSLLVRQSKAEEDSKATKELDEKITKLRVKVQVETLVKMGAAEIPETREAASSRNYNQLSKSSKEEV